MPNPTPKHTPTKLTNGYIDRIKPGPKDEFHWDTDAKGFGLRVSTTAKRVFVVQGRLEPKKSPARITVGPYGVFTVDQARDVAREHLRSMRMAIDPRAVKKQSEAAGVTLKQVFESYVGRPGKLKESTRKWYEFYVTKVYADWQDRAVVEINRNMVKERHAQIASEGLKGKKRGGAAPASANSAMVVLRILLNYAADEHQLADGSPLISVNPVGAFASAANGSTPPLVTEAAVGPKLPFIHRTANVRFEPEVDVQFRHNGGEVAGGGPMTWPSCGCSRQTSDMCPSSYKMGHQSGLRTQFGKTGICNKGRRRVVGARVFRRSRADKRHTRLTDSA